MSVRREILDGWEVIRFTALDRCGWVRHAVSTRRQWDRGQAIEANLSLHDGPDWRQGLANRLALCRRLGLDETRLTWGRQVHRDGVCVIGPRGRPPMQGIPDTDGLVTDAPGVPLLCLSADCPLIALVDPRTPAVGVVHASWRSTVQRIAQVAVATMKSAFDSRPEEMLAGIGPSAGPRRYEIGQDVIEAVRGAFGHTDWIVQRDGTNFLDLWSANAAQLAESGLDRASIAVAGMCTISQADLFYSYRREGVSTGRFGLMIGMAPR